MNNCDLKYYLEMSIETDNAIVDCLFEDQSIQNDEFYNIDIKKSKFLNVQLLNINFEKM